MNPVFGERPREENLLLLRHVHEHFLGQPSHRRGDFEQPRIPPAVLGGDPLGLVHQQRQLLLEVGMMRLRDVVGERRQRHRRRIDHRARAGHGRRGVEHDDDGRRITP